MPALLASLKSQSAPLETLQRALTSGRVHHAYLFEGENGVGKELAAFGLAQALECERRAQGAWESCSACSACERVLPKGGVSRHPDVVVLERGLYEPAQIGRKNPETAELSIDQVRTLVLARAAFPPHEGRAKVFIVRRAEELSISAANALLKTLEEPGARTHFVLMTTQPDALLPTILSRTLRVHFGSLSDSTVVDILNAH
ncbi:MAG: ATP-binding protein, partial [Polyangiaceae bacterium]